MGVSGVSSVVYCSLADVNLRVASSPRQGRQARFLAPLFIWMISAPPFLQPLCYCVVCAS